MAQTAGQGTAQRPTFTLPTGGFNNLQPPPMPVAKSITPNGTVVEDVVARVNDQVITRTEYERAEQGLAQEAQQEKWTPAQLADKQHTLLRDMIDQQLLLSKGKELGITGDAEVTRQLDEIRKRANLPDMESLEKAAAEQGVSYEDFKQNIRNQVITQQVVRDEVGRKLNMTPSQERSYYDAHKDEFSQPEQLHLSEILVPTPDNATDAQITEAQGKADTLEAKLKAGGNFADVAKASSGGPTASAGGDLGDFKRGMLGDVLEKATFDLPVGGTTAPIRTRQGFVILKVDSHQQAGTPPLQDVENQVQEGLYMSELQPALRTYLTQARQDAYLETKPGFVDTGATGNEGHTSFTSYTPPPVKKKIIKKQRAEQAKAEKAERTLAAAREKVAEKAQAKQAAKGGVQNASLRTAPRKIKREKVRYGQAPRNALPNGTAESAQSVPSLGSSAEGDNTAASALGTTAAGGNTATSIAVDGNAQAENPLEAQNDEAEHKTRFSARQNESEEKLAEKKLAKAEVNATKRPQKATQEQSADEKIQASPLGLADKGTTDKKAKKAKRPKAPKGTPKERLQDQAPAPVAAPPEVAPTVNPALGTSPTSNPTRPLSGTSDQTTLPSPSASPANAPPDGKPIPAVTGTEANPPTSTVPQPQ